MATPTSGSTADADDPSGEVRSEPGDGDGVRLEGEVISKRPSLSAALSFLPFHRRNGTAPDGDVEPAEDG